MAVAGRAPAVPARPTRPGRGSRVDEAAQKLLSSLPLASLFPVPSVPLSFRVDPNPEQTLGRIRHQIAVVVDLPDRS